MRVLVTGAFGYFGQALVQRLSAQHEVVPMGHRRGHLVSGHAGHEVLDMVADNLRGIEAVVHLAGGRGPVDQPASPADLYARNAATALHVASLVHEVRREHIVPVRRAVLASSVHVYAGAFRPGVPSDTPMAEDVVGQPLGPLGRYGRAKLDAEFAWRALVPVGVALRFAHVYGIPSVGVARDVDAWGAVAGRDGVTERLARAAAWGESFELHGDGSQRVDLVHVDDAYAAIEAALVAERVPICINIGGGPPGATVLDLVQAFGVTPELPDHLDESRRPEPGVVMDIERARRVLGWEPRVALPDGVRALVDAAQRFTGATRRPGP